MPIQTPTHVAFSGHTICASGTLAEVALALKAQEKDGTDMPLIFEMQTGRQIDLNLRGTEADIEKRYAPTETLEELPETPGAPKKRGRPKLGVIGREVTLLPRHWQWLDTQRGGPSAALRRLIDQARKDYAEQDRVRQAQDRANRFMSVMAGDLPGFEEATRALYAGDKERFEAETMKWPKDVRAQAVSLAGFALAGR